MFYRRLRARVGTPAALAISVAAWALVVVAVAILIVVVQFWRSQSQADRRLDRIEAYEVVSEHAVDGTRTEYRADSSLGGGFAGTTPQAEVRVTYKVDRAVEGLEGFVALAESEGWLFPDGWRGREAIGARDWNGSLVGVMYMGESRPTEQGTEYERCDDLIVHAEYSDPEGPALLRVEVFGGGGCVTY